MQHGISISAISFDNEPFTRSLTATIMSKVGTRFLPATGSGIIQWQNASDITADSANVVVTNLSGSTYTFGTTAQVSAFGTAIFKFTAPTYNYLTQSYRLYNFTPVATFLSGAPLSTVQTTSIDIPYDSFPNINLSAYLNFQVTEAEEYFYRLTSSTPYIAVLSLSSTTFNLKNLSANFYNTQLILNNTTDFNTLSTFSFNRVNETLSSVKVVLSALSATGSLSPWYTPHRLERALTAVFVNNYISASPFIAYPGEYFNTYTTRKAIDSTNIQESPGLDFYGEGHTEKIYLSAQPSQNVNKYVWKFGNFTNTYTPLVSGTTSQLSSAVVSISTQTNFYPRIPIQLQATNSTFLSSSPLYYYDDVTGIRDFYPYVTSTVSPYGNELSTSKYFSSIVVKPYDSSEYVFNPGSPTSIYLPTTNNAANSGTPVNYQASLQVQLTAGIFSTGPCFQLYGIEWKWSTFENCLIANTFVNKPSSWATTQGLISAGTLTTVDTAGRFSKKWGYQPPLSADIDLINPVFCTPGSTTWRLFTKNWSRPLVISASSINPSVYPYSLQLLGYGTKPLTVSYYDDTKITLNVQKPITCYINVSSYGAPSDWIPKTTNLNLTHEILSRRPIDLKFYTPNRFVLSGVPVNFENLSSNTSVLCSITIKFNDNTPTIVLTGTKMSQNFKVVFNSIGKKTLTVSGKIGYNNTTTVLNLPNIVEVVTKFDEVNTEIYRSENTPLTLPYPEQIKIAANDWAVADVFNACVERLYKNLQYLETRGYSYSVPYSVYYGWLGSLPPPAVSGSEACSTYMWRDVNCNITPENKITWTDVLSTSNFVGNFAQCGTWLQQTCSTKKVSPGCFQLYCTVWQWNTRKRTNTDKPITWKQTKCDGIYKKRWYFEPCAITQPIVCDEGFWNVNIPKLNTYYDPLIDCRVNSACSYYGVVSRNNIIYTAQKTQINVLSSDYQATPITRLNLLDEVTSFSNIKNVCLNSEGKIVVLDSDLLQVGIYTLREKVWETFITWGGIGTAGSQNKFLNPQDIHVDSEDNIWVADTGNFCVKGFSSTGAWGITIQNDELKTDAPLSMCVDSNNNIHILTKKQISVYDNTGNFLYSYDYKSYVTNDAIRINTSYNREIIYLCTDTQVIKFFKNGEFYSYIIQSKNCVNNITSIYQDEFRNLLITTNDKILKYPDLMKLVPLKGPLPDYYWKLEDLRIHPEEYIQNWVYTKSLQRLWDCIELFRTTVLFNNSSFCKQYKGPVYKKEDIVIGQNEIVTSVVLNRCLGYLWQNFSTLLNYFDPNC